MREVQYWCTPGVFIDLVVGSIPTVLKMKLFFLICKSFVGFIVNKSVLSGLASRPYNTKQTLIFTGAASFALFFFLFGTATTVAIGLLSLIIGYNFKNLNSISGGYAPMMYNKFDIVSQTRACIGNNMNYILIFCGLLVGLGVGLKNPT